MELVFRKTGVFGIWGWVVRFVEDYFIFCLGGIFIGIFLFFLLGRFSFCDDFNIIYLGFNVSFREIVFFLAERRYLVVLLYFSVFIWEMGL